MTAKDFNALAKIVKAVADKAIRVSLAVDIGRLCADSNVHFNWSKWCDACGVPHEAVHGK